MVNFYSTYFQYDRRVMGNRKLACDFISYQKCLSSKSGIMKHIFLLLLSVLLAVTLNAQNLHVHPNAASIDNEQNSTAGWSGPADIDSENDNPKHGNYSIKIESEDDGSHAQYNFEADPGTSYTIGIWAKRGQGGNPVFDEWEGFSGFQKKNITGQGWKEYIFTLTATSSHPVIKVFASKNGNDNKSVYIDAVSIIANNQGGGNDGGGSGGGGDLNVYHEGNANLPTVNWQAFNLYSSGNAGIGTNPSESFRLSVNGKIRAKEVIVESDWSDFVFEPGYFLPTLVEVEKYIHDFGHLKDIPSAKEVHENGVEVGEINKRLLQKIEELTLYMIKADKQIAESNERIKDLETEVFKLKNSR